MPRSGTSLLMQMLAAGGVPPFTDGVRAPDDDNPRGYLELEAVMRLREDASWLAQAEGKAVKVIHALVTSLPPIHEYRVVFMRRSLDEVIRSQAAMLRRAGKPDSPLAPDRLAVVFRQQLSQAESHLRSHACFRVVDIEYARLVADPREAVEAIDALHGNMLDRAAMARAVDPSLYRNRA